MKFIAALSSFAGEVSAFANSNGGTNTPFVVSVKEDPRKAAENNHIPEAVEYFAFSQARGAEADDCNFFV